MKSFGKSVFLVLLLPALFAACINVEILAMVAFIWEGMLTITFPEVSFLLGGSGRQNTTLAGCYGNHSWILEKLVGLTERRLADDEPHDGGGPVREAEVEFCSNTLLSTAGGRLAPFIIRGDGNRQFNEFSSSWLLKRYPNVSVTAMDMGAYDEFMEEISICPKKRFALDRHNIPLKDMAEQTHLYASFNGKTLETIYRDLELAKSDFIQFIDNKMHMMCDAFYGMDGELFFGWTSSKSSVSGTGFHCAAMENLFLQVHGERNWTLVDPRYTMRMRPMHGRQHLSGTGLYEQSWNTLKRPSHWDSIPKMTVTTRPGDILFIPTWWWHEVRIENDDFSLGISNRNHWKHLPWRQYPIVRFIPGVLSKFPNGAGLMPFFLDVVHVAPTYLGVLLYQMGIIADERLDIFFKVTVEDTQHEVEYPE